jgi:hypothetical protein
MGDKRTKADMRIESSDKYPYDCYTDYGKLYTNALAIIFYYMNRDKSREASRCIASDKK